MKYERKYNNNFTSKRQQWYTYNASISIIRPLLGLASYTVVGSSVHCPSLGLHVAESLHTLRIEGEEVFEYGFQRQRHELTLIDVEDGNAVESRLRHGAAQVSLQSAQ